MIAPRRSDHGAVRSTSHVMATTDEPGTVVVVGAAVVGVTVVVVAVVDTTVDGGAIVVERSTVVATEEVGSGDASCVAQPARITSRRGGASRDMGAMVPWVFRDTGKGTQGRR